MKQFIVPPAPLQMVDTNILGPLAVTQALVPHMAAQASGKIINVSHSSHRANGAASVCVDVASHPALGSHLHLSHPGAAEGALLYPTAPPLLPLSLSDGGNVGGGQLFLSFGLLQVWIC